MTVLSDSRARLFAENAPLPAQSLDGKGIILWVNSKWSDLLGYTKEEVLGKEFVSLLAPESKNLMYTLFEHLLRTGYLNDADLTILRKDGTEAYININSKLMHDPDNQELYTYCVLSDISKRHLMESQLIESEERYRKLFEYSLEGIVISKGDTVIAANKAFLDDGGYGSFDEFIKVPISKRVTPESYKLMIERRQRRMRGEEVDPYMKLEAIRKDNGETFMVEASSTEIPINGETHLLSTFRKISEEAQNDSTLDEITGLHNKTGLMDILAREISRIDRYGGEFSVLMFEVNDAKHINDTYGPDVYSEGLLLLTQRLLQHNRKTDHVCKYSDKQFFMVLPETGSDGAFEHAERFAHEVMLSISEEKSIPLTFSIGVAEMNEEIHDADELLQGVKSALDLAIAEGKNKVVLYQG
jgi:diguanylate cyclase (GGDEF)-like protein/PAS domain S-box-containing protein